MATNFEQMTAKEILKPEAVERHTAEMAYFHDKLARLHHRAFFIQQIVRFPFDLFVHPAEDLFLHMALHDLAQSAILQITKLTTDNGGDARTLPRFKNFMDRSVKDEYLADYRLRLAEVRFKPRTETLIGKAKVLRDKQIAHAVSDQVDTLTYSEIGEIIQELTRLFEAASFGTEYRYLTLWYDPDARRLNGMTQGTDIEKILDGIARDSSVLHIPETNPTLWPRLRISWSPQSKRSK
jgi:AbiU2